MAQNTTYSRMGRNWDQRHDCALIVAQRCADEASSGEEMPISSSEMTALFLRLYSPITKILDYEIFEKRDEDVGTIRGELEHYKITDEKRADSIEILLVDECEIALAGWRLGNPEDPPTKTLVNSIEHILRKTGLTNHPEDGDLPISLKHE